MSKTSPVQQYMRQLIYVLSKACADRRLLHGILTGRGATVPGVHRPTRACTTGIVTASLDLKPSLYVCPLSVTRVFTCGHVGQLAADHMQEQLGDVLPDSPKIVTSSLKCNAVLIGTVIYRRDTVAPALPIRDAFALTYAVLLHRHCH